MFTITWVHTKGDNTLVEEAFANWLKKHKFNIAGEVRTTLGPLVDGDVPQSLTLITYGGDPRIKHSHVGELVTALEPILAPSVNSTCYGSTSPI